MLFDAVCLPPSSPRECDLEASRWCEVLPPVNTVIRSTSSSFEFDGDTWPTDKARNTGGGGFAGVGSPRACDGDAFSAGALSGCGGGGGREKSMFSRARGMPLSSFDFLARS